MAYTSKSANLIFNFHMPEFHLFLCNKVTCITASLKHVFCLLLCFHSLEDKSARPNVAHAAAREPYVHFIVNP